MHNKLFIILLLLYFQAASAQQSQLLVQPKAAPADTVNETESNNIENNDIESNDDSTHQNDKLPPDNEYNKQNKTIATDKKIQSPYSFEPSEKISEDLSVAFPFDI